MYLRGNGSFAHLFCHVGILHIGEASTIQTLRVTLSGEEEVPQTGCFCLSLFYANQEHPLLTSSDKAEGEQQTKQCKDMDLEFFQFGMNGPLRLGVHGMFHKFLLKWENLFPNKVSHLVENIPCFGLQSRDR